MALILHIETATQICSTALSLDGRLVEKMETDDPRSHARRLAPFIDHILKNNNVEVSGLDAVSISLGPGSFTGLRIGVSTAKGLAYGAGIPVIGVATLQALANRLVSEHPALLEENEANGLLLCPMIDARRMEVYTALFNPRLEIVREVRADIIVGGTYDEYLEAGPVVFFGNGSEKSSEIITHPNAIFIPGIEASAEFSIRPAESSWERKEFLDNAYFEPYYLKDFIATVPKNKIIPPQNGRKY